MLHEPQVTEYESLLLQFAKYLERRDPPLSFASITAYESDARLFATFLRNQGATLLPPPPTLEYRYLDSLRLKPDTVRRKATALRYFREFALTVPWPHHISGGRRSHAPKQAASGTGRAHAQYATLGDLVREFVASRPSVRTSRAYCSDLRYFLTSSGEDIGPLQAAAAAQQFVDDASGSRKLKASSLRRLAATLHSFFGWACQNGYIQKREIPTINCPAKCEEVDESQSRLSAEEVEQAIQRLHQRASPRDEAIIHLLSEGLTPAEIVALNVSAFESSGIRILVVGRKERQRYVPLSNQGAEAVMALIKKTRTPEETHVPLIVNLRGGRLTTRSVARIVKKVAALADLPSQTHPLSLRKAGAQSHFSRQHDAHTLRHRLGISGALAAARYMRD